MDNDHCIRDRIMHLISHQIFIQDHSQKLSIHLLLILSFEKKKDLMLSEHQALNQFEKILHVPLSKAHVINQRTYHAQ